MKERVKNIEKLESFLKANCKKYLGNIEDYINDLDTQYCNSGSEIYELSRFETKSGNPECISYELKYNEDTDFWYIEF